VKRTAEVKWNNRFDIIPGCTEYDKEPEVIKTFDNLGAAIKELYQYKTKINEFSASTGTMYQVTEYAVQEIYGDDVEIWEVSEMDIVVQNNKTYEDVAVLHSYEDAEKYIVNHDGELRIEF
jgi:hypothetical protein